jgi:hypothetical protein
MPTLRNVLKAERDARRVRAREMRRTAGGEDAGGMTSLSQPVRRARRWSCVTRLCQRASVLWTKRNHERTSHLVRADRGRLEGTVHDPPTSSSRWKRRIGKAG